MKFSEVLLSHVHTQLSSDERVCAAYEKFVSQLPEQLMTCEVDEEQNVDKHCRGNEGTVYTFGQDIDDSTAFVEQYASVDDDDPLIALYINFTKPGISFCGFNEEGQKTMMVFSIKEGKVERNLIVK